MSDVNTMLNDFVDLNDMVNEIEKTTAKKFWRPTLPKTNVRILPPIKANQERLPFISHKVHWINGQPYECLNQTMVDKNGEMHTATECPICKMAKQLYAAKTDEAMALAKQISAKTRYVARIIVRDDKTLGDTPVFYELPFSIYDKFKNAIASKEWGSLVGPMDGRDLEIVKNGEGKYTNYDASSFKPVTSKIFEDTTHMVEILQQAKDMSYNSLISFQDAETLKAAAMDNEEVARFFGTSTPVTTVAQSKPVEYVVSNDDLIPQAAVAVVHPTEAPATTTGSDIDDLLASLV